MGSVNAYPKNTTNANYLRDTTLVTDNSAAGISDASSVNALIAGNTVEHNGWTNQWILNNGIGISHLNFATGSTKDVVRDNVVRNNYGAGVSLIADQGNQILNNTATGNGLQSGRWDLLDFNVKFYPKCGNVWSGNIFNTAFPDCAGANTPHGAAQMTPQSAITGSMSAESVPTRHLTSYPAG